MKPTWIRQLSLKGILIGGIADIVATNIAVFPVALVVFAGHDVSKASSAQQIAAFAAGLDANPSLYATTLIVGSICSVFGGWIAARVAKREYVLNGMFSGVVCVTSGIYGWVRNPAVIPVWQHLAYVVLTPALGALGGVIYGRLPAQQPQVSSASEDGSEDLPLSTFERSILLANRIGLCVASLTAALYGLSLPFLPEKNKQAAMIGVIVFLALALIGAVLFYFAGRAIVRRKSHWLLHGAAVGCALIPVAALIYGFTHTAGAG